MTQMLKRSAATKRNSKRFKEKEWGLSGMTLQSALHVATLSSQLHSLCVLYLKNIVVLSCDGLARHL